MDLNVTGEEIPAANRPKRGRNAYTRRSDVWQYMEKDICNGRVQCKLCGFRLTSTSRSGTSNLRNHLLNRHADLYRPQNQERIPPQLYILSDGENYEDENGKSSDDTTGMESPASQPHHDQQDLQSLHEAGTAAAGSKVASGAGVNKRTIPGRSAAAASKKRAVIKLQAAQSRGRVAKNSTTALSRPNECSLGKSKIISNFIFRMMVEDLLPVSVVDGAGFQGLVTALQHGYKFPTQFNIAQRLKTKLVEGRCKLKSLMSAGQKVGLSCSLWADYQNRNFVTTKAHYINQDWKDESWVLGTIQVSASATDEEVSKQMKSLCLECGISFENVSGVVYGTDHQLAVADTTERLKVMQTICTFLSMECRPCAGELISISVQNALSTPAITNLIQSAGQLILHLNADVAISTNLSTLLKERREPMVLTACDTSSGWALIMDAFSQLLKMQSMISQVLMKKEGVNLSEAQWSLLQELLQALQGVKAALAVMNDPKNSSGSCWLPVMQGVLQHVELQHPDISDDGQVFRNTLSSELKARCELNQILPSSLMMQASAIDPRFHHLRFLCDEDRSPVIEEMKRRLTEKHCSGSSSGEREAVAKNPDIQEDSPFFTLLGEDEFNPKSVKPEDEVDLFRMERPISRETDPLNWWKLNEERFPGLAKLARATLCVPVAATPVWNDKIKTALENRKRLDPAHVDAQVFLHQNMSLFL